MNIRKEINSFKIKAYKNICNTYHCNLFIAGLIAKITRNDSFYRYSCYKYLRKYMNDNIIFLKLYCYRKYSYYAHKINVQLVCNSIGENFYFEHGDIVINKNCSIGDNVRLVGNNCIGGNKDGAPILMNNIDVGWGVCLIGKITICDNVIIGANATITKNIIENGTYVSINKKIK